MENKSNTSIAKVLQNSSLLSEYISKANSLEKLDQIIKQYLQPELAKNCRVASFNDNCLILATTSPAWNHRLKFFLPELLNKLRKLPKYCGLKSIEAIQIPNLASEIITEKNPDLKQMQLSNSNAKQLLAAAENITSPKLAEALRKIANKHIS